MSPSLRNLILLLALLGVLASAVCAIWWDDSRLRPSDVPALAFEGTARTLAEAERQVTNPGVELSSQRLPETVDRESEAASARVVTEPPREAAPELAAERTAEDGSSWPLKGRVVTIDGRPIASARIVITRALRRWGEGERVVVSDGEGRFDASVPDPGPFDLFVTHRDWRPARSEEVLAAFGSEVTIELREGMKMLGQVVDPAGSAIEGARVSLIATRPSQLLDVERTTVTDADGCFELNNLQEGNNRIEVDAKGFALLRQDMELGRTEDQEVRFELVWSERLTGVVVDDRGAPLPQALIKIAGERTDASCISDLSGYFSCDRIADEDLRALVTASGFANAMLEDVRIEQTPLRVALARSLPITGHVRDHRTGQPVEGAKVIVRREGRTGRTSTDSDGSFQTPGLPPGELSIEVLAEGYPRRRIERQDLSMASPLLIELEKGATVHGRVLGPDGEPLPGVQVRVREKKRPTARSTSVYSWRPSFDAASTTSEVEGDFVLTGLEDGEYTVAAAHPDFRLEHSEDVLIADGRAGGFLRLRMAPGCDLRGRVSHEGEPVTRGFVRIEDLSGTTVRRLKLDGEGRYVAKALAPGTYRLSPEQTLAPVEPKTIELLGDSELDLGR